MSMMSRPSRPTSFTKAASSAAAAGYAPISKICEPMWQCRPTMFTLSAARQAATAAAARPPSSEKPNLLSSWPVEMYSCVDGFTPGVTRMSTSCTTPRSPAMRLSRAISSRLSHTSRPTRASSASLISLASFALPCITIFCGGNPACSAMNSSPPDATSTRRSSSCTMRSTAWAQKALLA